MALNSMKIFRWLTLILLVVMVLVLAGLAAVRVSQKRPSRTEVDTDEMFGETGSTTLGVSNEFKYVEQVRGQMIFALEALRTLGKSSGWYDIEGVSVQLFDEDESKGPMLTCQNANFNIDTKNAELTGSVQVEFPDGAFLSTEIGMLLGGGRKFESGASVTFVGENLLGRAGSVDYDMAREILRLGDGVVVRSEDGHSLVAPVVEYRRRDGHLVLPGGGDLVFGNLSLSAPAGQIDLEENSHSPRRIIFSGGVTIRGVDPGGDQSILAWAERFEAERDADDRWQIVASTQRRWVEVDFSGGKTALHQSLRAWDLRAVVGSGGILNMVGDGRVCLENISVDGERRRAEGQTLRVWFDEGQTSDIELQKDVVIYEGDITATAYRARVDALKQQVFLQSNPVGRTSRVTLVSDRGRLAADQALLSQASGDVEARGRVQGEMEGISVAGSKDGRNDIDGQTGHVACEKLTITKDGTEFRLSEGARVWQGQRLLVADEITYLPELRTVAASGHASTTFPATMLDQDAVATDDVVLSARSITFDDVRRRAVYRGNVGYTDGRQTMAAALLEISISDGELESVEAMGSVEVESLETGQKFTGSSVVYDVKSKNFFLTGEPAQAIDTNGNLLSGRSLTFNQASGRVTVADETETVYHPEEKP